MKTLHILFTVVFGNKLQGLGKRPTVLLTLTNVLLSVSSKVNDTEVFFSKGLGDIIIVEQ